MPSAPEEADRFAAMHVEELWQEGDSRYLAQDVVSALQHYEPQLKRKMLRSWRLLKAWQQHEIPTQAPPLTPTTLSVLAGWMHQQSPELALALMLGFHGLLRTGELLRVTNKDIICSGDLVVVNLGPTKMAARNAGVESTSFRNREVSFMLQAWKAVHQPDAFLVHVSPSAFRQRFSQGLEKTGLQVLKYKPYSLRRGGATHVFLVSQSYSLVCQRGRWSSERTARIYIQDSISMLTDIPKTLDARQREFRELWMQVLRRLELPSMNARRSRGRGRNS